MKKSTKKFIILGCTILGILIVLEIIRIFAVFQSDAEGSTAINSAKWNIKVNGVSIVENESAEFTIDKIKTSEKVGVMENKLAPGMTGTYDLEIDANDTDVSVRYDLTLDETKMKEYNFKVQKVKDTTSNTVLTKTASDTYTGVLTLEQIKASKKAKIEIEILWEEIDDDKETELGTIYTPNLQMPVTVLASQYLGEEITEYVPEETVDEEP